ncbi:Zn-ribbon domain-containing OB-fold protein [Gordonia sp. NPDC003504]
MAQVARSQLTDRPNKRRAGADAGGLSVAESRPQFVDGILRGARCTRCRHALPQTDVPWCPVCFGEIEPAGFAPAGTVWAATTVRMPVGRWSPPFALAYVDVDDGARVLVHVSADPAPHAGGRVSFDGRGGDLVELGVAAPTDPEESEK